MKHIITLPFWVVLLVTPSLLAQTDSLSESNRYAYAPKQHQVGLGFAGRFGLSTQPRNLHRELMTQLSYGYFFRQNWMLGLRATHWYRETESIPTPQGNFWQVGPFIRYYANFRKSNFSFFPEVGYQVGSFFHSDPSVPNSHLQEGVFSYLSLGLGMAWRFSPNWEGEVVIQRVRPIGCTVCGPSIEGSLGLKYYLRPNR